LVTFNYWRDLRITICHELGQNATDIRERDVAMVLHVYYLRGPKHVFIIQIDGWPSRHTYGYGVRGMGRHRGGGYRAIGHFCFSRANHFLAAFLPKLARFLDRWTANHHFPSLKSHHTM